MDAIITGRGPRYPQSLHCARGARQQRPLRALSSPGCQTPQKMQLAAEGRSRGTCPSAVQQRPQTVMRTTSQAMRAIAHRRSCRQTVRSAWQDISRCAFGRGRRPRGLGTDNGAFPLASGGPEDRPRWVSRALGKGRGRHQRACPTEAYKTDDKWGRGQKPRSLRYVQTARRLHPTGADKTGAGRGPSPPPQTEPMLRAVSCRSITSPSAFSSSTARAPSMRENTPRDAGRPGRCWLRCCSIARPGARGGPSREAACSSFSMAPAPASRATGCGDSGTGRLTLWANIISEGTVTPAWLAHPRTTEIAPNGRPTVGGAAPLPRPAQRPIFARYTHSRSDPAAAVRILDRPSYSPLAGAVTAAPVVFAAAGRSALAKAAVSPADLAHSASDGSACPSAATSAIRSARPANAGRSLRAAFGASALMAMRSSRRCAHVSSAAAAVITIDRCA
mmetsp:Transcript_37685/g.62619  ORF Transcript_37685/g.62619 Transcript_37685/m.62619 type:complete len:448 (-) Transcript_37685:61-1404(-)